jgi:hypothetical protein
MARDGHFLAALNLVEKLAELVLRLEGADLFHRMFNPVVVDATTQRIMPIDKRAAKAAYRERKSVAGIYAVRCAATGQVWVGHTPTLDTVRNRLWFTLRQNNHIGADLQRAWAEHGADSFTFEVLEPVKDDDLSYTGDGALKARAAAWRAKLGALDAI